MPTPHLTPQGTAALDALLASTAAERNVPAVFFGVATTDGEIYFNCAGEKVFGKPEEGLVDADTTLQLFSMTKLATVIAILQLRQQGLIELDSPEFIAKHLPEVTKLRILTGFNAAGEPEYAERKTPLTLRHLLTHTSGLGYAFLNPTLAQWEQVTGAKGPLSPGAGIDAFEQVLLFEPGTQFAYSIGIDWAGILVERLSGVTLDEYFVKHIWKPLGIKTLTFYPTPEITDRLMAMTARAPTGQIVVHPGLRPTETMTPDQVGLHSGGAGLYGTIRDYLRFLQEVLACKDREGIINPDSWKLLFTDQLPPRAPGNPCHAGVGALLTMAGTDVPEQQDGSVVSWSLGMGVVEKDSPHGRKAGSGNWEGVAKTKYWIDPKSGIVAVCGTQNMDTDASHFAAVLHKFEEAVYAGLETS